jgi:hypothetical protein
LAIAATAALVILQLAGGVLLDHSHASPAMVSPGYAVPDEATCPEARQPEPFLPYD